MLYNFRFTVTAIKVEGTNDLWAFLPHSHKKRWKVLLEKCSVATFPLLMLIFFCHSGHGCSPWSWSQTHPSLPPVWKSLSGATLNADTPNMPSQCEEAQRTAWRPPWVLTHSDSAVKTSECLLTPSQTPKERNSSCSSDLWMSQFSKLPPLCSNTVGVAPAVCTHGLHVYTFFLICDLTLLWVSARYAFQFTYEILTGWNLCTHKWHIYISRTSPEAKSLRRTWKVALIPNVFIMHMKWSHHYAHR